MAQEFWDENEQRQLMEKVIDLLKKYNIDFTVDDDKIMIVGNLKYVDIGSFPTISIWQGGNEIAFDKLANHNSLVIKTPTRSSSSTFRFLDPVLVFSVVTVIWRYGAVLLINSPRPELARYDRINRSNPIRRHVLF